jgi:hypothetical protein
MSAFTRDDVVALLTAEDEEECDVDENIFNGSDDELEFNNYTL